MGKAVLFVEDEADIRELVVERIQDTGFLHKVYEASDPVQGLDLFHKHKDEIGFLVCDYYLPIQNGNDLCKMIKESSPGCKIICLTGDTSVTLEDHKSEVDIILYKPEGVEELLKLISK